MSFQDYVASLESRAQDFSGSMLADVLRAGAIPGFGSAYLAARHGRELTAGHEDLVRTLAGAAALAVAQAPYSDPGLAADTAAVRAAAGAAPDWRAALLAADAEARRQAPLPTTGLELLVDPLSYVGGPLGKGGKALEATRLAPLGRLLRGVDEAAVATTSLPFEALKAARTARARRLGAEIAEKVPHPPAVELPPLPPPKTLPLPPAPPSFAAPPRPPLTAENARDLFLNQIMEATPGQRGGVLSALEAANFGGGVPNARRSVTGRRGLTDLGELERDYVSYLLQRTIENPDAISALQGIHPALHRAVDLMPDLPGATALDLQNAVRRAAGLAEKAPKGARAAKVAVPVAEAIAPQEAAQGATGASEAAGGGMMMVSPLAAGIQAGKAAAPTVEQLGKNIGAQEFVPGVREGLARMNRSWGGAPVRGGFWSYVRSSSIQNPRNLLQDPATTRAISRVFNADLATPLAHHGDVANLLDTAQEQLVRNAGAATPFGKQADVLQDTARAVLGEDRVFNLGGGGIAGQAENALRDMPYLQRLTYQLGTDVLGAARGNPTSLLTLPAAPVKAALRPVIDEAFRRMNRLSQVAGREGMAANVLAGEAERAAPAFLDGLRAAGVDVTPLAAKSGQFSPQEVAALAGAQAGREWRTIAEQAAAVAERETKHYFGDFARANLLESIPVVNKLVWLSSWSTRMLPVFAEIAARHPGPTLAYAGLVRAQGEQLTGEGKPPYQAGTLPVPGTNLRVDPVQGLSPVGGEVLSMGQGDEGARSPYQTGEDILGKFGIPLHPAVRAGAYATGLTPQRPSDLNRTAGLERLPQLALQGAGVGLPYLPPFGQIALDTTRRGLNAIKEKAGLPTSSIPPTPIEKRMAELWYEQTGSPLASSPEGLFLSLDKNSDLYKLAERDVLRGQGVTNAASYTLPVGVQTDNPTASVAHAARAEQPHTYDEIDATRTRGDLAGARRMQAENARFMAEHPQAAIYQGVSLDARKAALKDEWDRLHANWPKNAYYDAQRAAFRAWIDAGAPGDPPGPQQPKTIPPPKKAPLPALSGR